MCSKDISSPCVDLTPQCTIFGPLPFFSLIFSKSHSQCEAIPAPTTFLIGRRGVSSLLVFRAVPPALNLFVVPKSQVANEAQENPKNFVKPLVGSDVLLLWIGKPGAMTCRWRIMCSMDSITMRSTMGRDRQASHDNCLPGSSSSDLCAIILMKLS